MDVAAVFLDLYGRIPPLATEAVEGLDLERLTRTPAPGTNSMAWLIWHVGRVLDHQMSEVAGSEQLWGAEWAGRFGVDPDPSNTGYGHSRTEAEAVRPERPAVLLEYLEAADARARDLLGGLAPPDLDRVIDRSWDPPVTLGVRLVSIADDCLQHVGQAAYLRGLLGA